MKAEEGVEEGRGKRGKVLGEGGGGGGGEDRRRDLGEEALLLGLLGLGGNELRGAELGDQLVQLELVADVGANVVAERGKLLQEGEEVDELAILGVVEPGLDRHTVVELEAEDVRGVVDEDDAGQLAAWEG